MIKKKQLHYSDLLLNSTIIKHLTHTEKNHAF